MKNLIIRTITGIVFVAAVVVSFVSYVQCPCIFYALFLFFTGMGCFELLRMTAKIGISGNFILSILLSVSVFGFHFCMMDGEPVFSLRLSTLFLACIVVLGLLIFIVEIFRRKPNALSNVAVSFLPALWVALPFAILGTMLLDYGPDIPLALFVILWMSDTLAYCAGSLFGSHRLCERISPKKSVEGLVASLVLTAGFSVSFYFIPYFGNGILSTPFHWVGLALIIVAAGTCGDLVESLFKRNCGVKDSGKILPGHGGILDRFDSSFLAIPAAWAYLLILG